MAEYILLPANIDPQGKPTTSEGSTLFAGEAIEAGQFVYKDSQGMLQLASNLSATTANVLGMAVNSAVVIGQPVAVVKSGEVIVGEDVFAEGNRLLVIGNTPGRMMEAADLADENYMTIVGCSTDTDKMQINIKATGIAYSVVLP